MLDGGAAFNRVGTNGDGLDDAAERNVISGNNVHGVTLAGATAFLSKPVDIGLLLEVVDRETRVH